jgi:AmmeMemoRadiSam system protein B
MKFGVSTAGKVRAPIVAGLFYPDEKQSTEARIRSFGLKNGEGGSATAIIAPHGAWEISGAAAGRAFSAAAGRTSPKGKRGDVSRDASRDTSLVVLLGCVHEVRGEGLFVSDSRYFETPLGNLPVDSQHCEELCSCSTLIEMNDIPHLQEHSLEVLLPLVKFCFPNAAIVPVLMAGGRSSQISSLARALRIVFEPILDSTLLVVSANLSKDQDPEASRSQAETCARLLENASASASGEQFIAGLSNGRLSTCGGGAVAALLQSGLLEGKTTKLLTKPLMKTIGEDNKTIYYGGFSFE